MPGAITFVVITGLSGAGKSYAIKCFEDMGFFCVDNLPTTLIPTFADLVARSNRTASRVALGVDVREGEYLTHLLDTLGELRGGGHTVEVLFLEASEEALVRRYRETRRRHPLAPEGNVVEGIRAERKALSTMREGADHLAGVVRLQARRAVRRRPRLRRPLPGQSPLRRGAAAARRPRRAGEGVHPQARGEPRAAPAAGGFPGLRAARLPARRQGVPHGGDRVHGGSSSLGGAGGGAEGLPGPSRPGGERDPPRHGS